MNRSGRLAESPVRQGAAVSEERFRNDVRGAISGMGLKGGGLPCRGPDADYGRDCCPPWTGRGAGRTDRPSAKRVTTLSAADSREVLPLCWPTKDQTIYRRGDKLFPLTALRQAEGPPKCAPGF